SAAVEAVSPAPVPRRWEITFKPFPELFARGNDPLRMLRELAELGELESLADLSAMPAFAQLDPQSCYMAWNLQLTADVEESAIKQVFEWAEGDCELQIELVSGSPTASAAQTGATSPQTSASAAPASHA